MYIVIAEEVLESWFTDTAITGDMLGVAIDDNSVIRMLGPLHSYGNYQKLGRWHKVNINSETTNDLHSIALTLHQKNDSPPNSLIGLLVNEPNPTCHIYFLNENGLLDLKPYELLSLYKDYRSRLNGLFDSTALAQATVGIVGLGTGGSVAAVELAKAGVGHIKLADFDRLKAHNIARHICGMNDLGRYKTDALKDFLINTSPIIKVETFNFNITRNEKMLEDFLSGCDCVIGAADSEVAKSFLNRSVWKHNIPAVYGAAYERGFGGDVFLALPPDGPCYECFRNATADIFASENLPSIGDYGTISPQPALGLDVSFPALILARAVLTQLLQKFSQSTLELQPFPSNWILWCNQPVPDWIDFDAPLQSRYIDIPVDEYCPVCHHENYLLKELGMTSTEAKEAADELIKNLLKDQ